MQSNIALVDRAIQQYRGTIKENEIDWNSYLKPSDKARVIAAEDLAEQGKMALLLGEDAEFGLKLPFNKADDKVLIRSGKLALWTGWQHHGKSLMLKQIMLGAIQQGEKVMIASMEEEVKELWRDLAILGCGTSTPSVGYLDKYIEFITGNLWLYDQEGMVSPNRILALMRYAAEEKGVSHVVIDSMMMLSMDRDDYDAQSRFAGQLKTMAKDTGCTAHLVCHMRKRDGAKGEETPGGVHDIAGGHEIGSKADYIFNVWRDKKRSDETKPSCILKVEKQRGRTNWIGNICLDHHSDSRQFTEGTSTYAFF